MIDEMKFPIKALDNWTLTQKLSDSGQSTTYHVTGKKDGQRGVLKLQNKRPGGAERLKTEAAILSSVNHRNVVKLLDTNASSTDTVIYLVTEWIPGPTLTQMINNTRAKLHKGTRM